MITQEKSSGHIADYQRYSMVDGEGVRASVYLSGCLFNCKGCYNTAAQDFNYGTKLTDEKIAEILDDIDESYCDGLSLLGGDPFFNIDTAMRIVQPFRERFGNSKTLWVWTGFTLDQLKQHDNAKVLLNEIDVLVDGPFIQEKFEPNLAFRGSTNQQIHRLKASTT